MSVSVYEKVNRLETPMAVKNRTEYDRTNYGEDEGSDYDKLDDAID